MLQLLHVLAEIFLSRVSVHQEFISKLNWRVNDTENGRRLEDLHAWKAEHANILRSEMIFFLYENTNTSPNIKDELITKAPLRIYLRLN